MHQSLRVHIIPVGRDEPERMINPAIHLKADRIYLVSISGEDARPEVYSKTKEILLKKCLLNESELIEKKIDYYDLNEILKLYASIFKVELEMGNTIYMNVAGGTMLTLAATISCILFGGIPYFLKKDYTTGKLTDTPKFLEFPHFVMEKPTENQTYLLTFMKEYMKEEGRSTISKGLCIDFLTKSGRDLDFEGKKPKDYNKLNNRYLNKLRSKNFIKEDEHIRGEISLTNDGFFVSEVFSIFYEVDSDKLHEFFHS